MTLDKRELDFIRRNEVIITKILEKRIDDLKDQILEVPEEKWESVIQFIKEYKFGLGLIKEINSDTKSPDFTGI